MIKKLTVVDNQVYDRIGNGYSATRRPDPRIAEQILEGLADSASVLNVGAGSGSYEPVDRTVFAVEPSATMIKQRSADSAPVVQGVAEKLPFADGAVDAALAILTVHHWTDPVRGIEELRRVARKRVVIFTWDQSVWESFWLVQEYFPCVRALDRSRAVATGDILTVLGGGDVLTVPIPHDCVDGFFGAFWRRPDAYLDSRVRAGISSYSMMSAEDLHGGLGKLADDVHNGAWEQKYGDLLGLTELDLGYRLIIASR